jgi:energy-coupling factor transport system substrate-specific component
MIESQGGNLMVKKTIPVISDFNTMAILLIPIGIAINYAGGAIVRALQLPIFLDTLGTILAGIIAGPWVGAATGISTNLITGITTNPRSLPFLIVNMAFGLAAGFMAQANWFERWRTVILAGFVMVALGVVLSVPIVIFFFGGVPDSAGASLVWAYLMAIGAGLWKSVFATSILRELADKFISVFIAFGVYKAIPKRFLVMFPGYKRRSRQGSDYL